MTKIKGIDVSYHNGTIEWNKVKRDVDFVMIRAGYGRGNIDKKFHEYSIGCEKNGIPYGYYWFSYAYTPEMAVAEADYCCDAIACFSPTYPIVFDFEYGSINYAKSHGYNLKPADVVAICRAFLDRVEERGYYAMFYSNDDFLEHYGLKELIDRYALWIAKWSNNPPTYNYGIWQYGTGRVNGIEGNVDLDTSRKNYHQIISSLYDFGNERKMQVALGMSNEWWNKYVLIAKRAIVGIYNDFEVTQICAKNGMDENIVRKVMDILYA